MVKDTSNDEKRYPADATDDDVNRDLAAQRSGAKAHVTPELAESLEATKVQDDENEEQWPKKVRTTLNDDVHEVNAAEYDSLRSQGILREED